MGVERRAAVLIAEVVVVAAAACCLAGCAAAPEPAPAEPERIVAAEGGSGWKAVRDSEILAAMDRGGAPPELLYFSRLEFEHAIRGLTPTQVAEVIEKRRTRFAPRALERAVGWLEKREPAGLDLPGRYADTALDELLVFVLEGEARGIAELEYSGRREEVASRRKFAAQIGAALARLGRPEFAEALPHVEVERVVFVRPRDPDTAVDRREGTPSVVWRDGIVMAVPFRKLVELEDMALSDTGMSVKVLYASEREFVRDMVELTRPQLERELALRLAHGAGADDELDHVRVDQALLRRYVLERARGKDAEVARILESQTPEGPRRNGDAIAADAVFFAELARRAGRADLQSTFAEISRPRPTRRPRTRRRPTRRRRRSPRGFS